MVVGEEQILGQIKNSITLLEMQKHQVSILILYLIKQFELEPELEIPLELIVVEFQLDQWQ